MIENVGVHCVCPNLHYSSRSTLAACRKFLLLADHHLDATILLTLGVGIVARYGFCLTKALRIEQAGNAPINNVSCLLGQPEPLRAC